jgi:hypothetical protein
MRMEPRRLMVEDHILHGHHLVMGMAVQQREQRRRRMEQLMRLAHRHGGACDASFLRVS